MSHHVSVAAKCFAECFTSPERAASLKPLNIVCFGLYSLEEGKVSWKQIICLSRRRNKIELNLEFVRDFEEATAEVYFLF